MRPNPHTSWIVVEAPDASAALALEKRLAHLGACAVSRDRQWSVELEDGDGRLDEIVAVVRDWLRERELRTTLVTAGRVTQTVSVDEPLVPYDGRVLVHEP
jgi:hypothetical protein